MDALILIGLLFFGLVPGFYLFAQYNALVALRNRIRRSRGNIDTELGRRCDLIPQLVEVTRNYATHERELFERIASLRDRCTVNRSSAGSQAQDENELASSLQTLLARAEAFPELRADAQFQNLHRELTDAEDGIQTACRFYNGHVRDYRNKCETFPSSLVAQMFGFQLTGFFEVEPVMRENPKPTADP